MSEWTIKDTKINTTEPASDEEVNRALRDAIKRADRMAVVGSRILVKQSKTTDAKYDVHFRGDILLCDRDTDVSEWRITSGSAELQEALDAWRGLSEEQRERFYKDTGLAGEVAESDAAHAAKRLLKAAAR